MKPGTDSLDILKRQINDNNHLKAAEKWAFARLVASRGMLIGRSTMVQPEISEELLGGLPLNLTVTFMTPRG